MFVVFFFNSFSTSKCFDLYEVTLLLRFLSLLSKSVLYTKLAISLFVTKFACANLAAKFSTANLLNFGVAIYLS